MRRVVLELEAPLNFVEGLVQELVWFHKVGYYSFEIADIADIAVVVVVAAVNIVDIVEHIVVVVCIDYMQLVVLPDFGFVVYYSLYPFFEYLVVF